MNPDFLTIEPEIEPSQRFGGWLLLGTVSLSIAIAAWMLTLPSVRAASITPDELPRTLFCGVIALGFLIGGAILGARMALETQTWIVGRDYFERRSLMLFWSRSKIYRATAWRLEHLHHNGPNYVLSPVGARIAAPFTPFYSSSNPRVALELGRQLANITGWPLRLSAELQRLEEEIQT